jgi:hypothetical protein
MRKFLLVLGIMALICSPAMAGKNAGGALVVHTDDAIPWSSAICNFFDTFVPQNCADLNTQTNMDELTTAFIWFIAAFPSSANPGVTVAYFGNDHNLPEFYHNRWGYCANGTTGSVEVPDSGWPEFPATAGTSVAYGQPILGDTFFAVYYFDVWGFAGAYYCSGINPTGGYAAYVDDSNPPVTDPVELFGCVRWYEPGNNECPNDGPLPGACCFEDGACILTEGLDACLAAGGYMYMGDGTLCSPNPCPQPGACCFDNGDCVFMLQELCTQAGGTLFIPGTVCEPNNPCPQPPQACCFADGSCQMLEAGACVNQGGTPWGEGTTCMPDNPCPLPMGGCCFADGSCQVTYEADCTGDYWVMFDDCEPNNCDQPDPEGACCYGCEECIVLTEADCTDLPDDYLWIEGGVCDPNPCPPVATETTTWGSIKANYK